MPLAFFLTSVFASQLDSGASPLLLAVWRPPYAGGRTHSLCMRACTGFLLNVRLRLPARFRGFAPSSRCMASAICRWKNTLSCACEHATGFLLNVRLRLPARFRGSAPSSRCMASAICRWKNTLSCACEHARRVCPSTGACSDWYHNL